MTSVIILNAHRFHKKVDIKTSTQPSAITQIECISMSKSLLMISLLRRNRFRRDRLSSRLAGTEEMSRDTLAPDLAEDAATARARLHRANRTPPRQSPRSAPTAWQHKVGQLPHRPNHPAGS